MSRYSQIKTRVINEENSKLKIHNSPVYPKVPHHENDIHVITEYGDRLTLLADQFYGDVNLYWVISIANPENLDMGSINIPTGTQLRIPYDPYSVINEFNKLNNLK